MRNTPLSEKEINNLIDLLIRCKHEITQHNQDYHHHTTCLIFREIDLVAERLQQMKEMD